MEPWHFLPDPGFPLVFRIQLRFYLDMTASVSGPFLLSPLILSTQHFAPVSRGKDYLMRPRLFGTVTCMFSLLLPVCRFFFLAARSARLPPPRANLALTLNAEIRIWLPSFRHLRFYSHLYQVLCFTPTAFLIFPPPRIPTISTHQHWPAVARIHFFPARTSLGTPPSPSLQHVARLVAHLFIQRLPRIVETSPLLTSFAVLPLPSSSRRLRDHL